MFDPNFYDDMGNLKPNARDADSENPSTCNAPFALMMDMLGRNEEFNIGLLNYQKHACNGGQYLTNEYDFAKYVRQLEDCKWWQWPIVYFNWHRYKQIYKPFKLDRTPWRFSHDETNSVRSTSFYKKDDPYYNFVNKKNLSKIKIMTPQTFYRFYDIGFANLYAKTGWKIFLIPVKFFLKLACKNTSKDHRGKYHAGGKQQAFITMYGLRLDPKFIRECKDLLPEEGKWEEVFSNYYWSSVNHPTNIVARECQERGLI